MACRHRVLACCFANRADDYLASLERDAASRTEAADPTLRFLDDWRPFTGFEIGALDVGEVGIDRSKARKGGYGKDALAMLFLPMSARFFRLINVKAEFGFITINDRAPIRNEVVCTHNCFDTPDGPFVAESTMRTFMLSVATGVAMPPVALGPVGLTLGCNLGVQAAWPYRDIDHCVDCDDDNLPALNGAFLEPTMLLGYAMRTGYSENVIVGLRGSYREFITGSGFQYLWSLGFAAAVYIDKP
jgi:hypothetical protein